MFPEASLQSAESMLREQVARQPQDIDSRRGLARWCAVAGNRQESVLHYSEILKVRQNETEALLAVGSYFLEQGALEQARTLFAAALASNPGNTQAQYTLEVLDRHLLHGRITQAYGGLYDLLLDEGKAAASGLHPEHVPCLIEINGDLLWMPGDLLKFLWHTVQLPLRSPVPAFLAETTHYDWIKARLGPGDTVFDVGANIGWFSLMMAARVGPAGQVYAFEPSPRIHADLRRVLALNPMPQIQPVQAAVSDQEGEALFCDIDEADVRRESSHLSTLAMYPQELLRHQTSQVRTLTLDGFAREGQLAPSLLKIDVEGAEFLVLEGARETIRAHRPLMVIEFHEDPSGFFDHARMQAFLQAYGYRFEQDFKNYYCWR